jgi:hypothetical protein
MEMTLRTSANLLEMARRFRDGAGATSMAEYVQLMNRTAEELEEMARYLETDADRWETPDRSTMSRIGANR